VRIDKTYSELWSISDHDDKDVCEIVKMTINTLQKLEKENRELQEELDKWIAEFMI
jgi:transcriptional regulator with XRE-family HTH domain